MARNSKDPSILTVVPEPAKSAPLANPTISRTDADKMLRARSIELFQEAKQTQQHNRQEFELKYGSIDRIDESILRDLQAMQMRFAAISARQSVSSYGEPKVSKFVVMLSTMIGDVSAYLATAHATTLFAPIRETDYIGYGSKVGEKGLDESILAGYTIVDDEPETPTAEATATTYASDAGTEDAGE